MTVATKPLVVLATGGTGGHVFPAEALAAELANRGCRLALVTDRRGGAYGGRLGAIETHRIRAAGIAGRGLLARLFSVVELGLGTIQARGILGRLRPAVVVGFGGYASVPTMLAATLAHMHTAIHEQNAVLGRANRLLAGRVDRIATSFGAVRNIPAGAGSKTVRTGMPVRPAIAAVRGRPYPALDEESPISLLILGGSQGASVFSAVVPQAIALLPAAIQARLSVVQQCRPEDIDAARAAYAKLPVRAELATFFDDVPERLVSAHLLITRAGASTVAELTAVGRPAILVPYPFAADDHQTYNAHAVDEAGGGWLMPQGDFTAEKLAARLENLFSMPQILRNAATGAQAAGRPDAAERLADEVCSLLGENGGDAPERTAA
ncbi:MAG: undecaprenyldiphospho-muramoylpentapeptide beta-N-acetylglucosaminyltransferase [Rhodospirillales bacterium]|nr:undecaprenyldiphospho-muramoylpentapeptide beta-N-acetylglucosaminyltransferase [Rhodospirillales bacterium]MCW8969795.1 undecaprenyldiphospho-muramoylpentapeptide beta-N-acetylglucosaminyltransferase [Rhodospirillales bacterium]